MNYNIQYFIDDYFFIFFDNRLKKRDNFNIQIRFKTPLDFKNLRKTSYKFNLKKIN